MVPILNGEKAAPAVMRATASPSTEATAAHNFLTASPSNADDAPFLTAPVAASSSGSSPSTSIASTGGGSLISTLPAQTSDWPQVVIEEDHIKDGEKDHIAICQTQRQHISHKMLL